MSFPPVPFVQIERSRSITLLPTSGSDSERSESPRTVLPDRDNGATAATTRPRGERSDSDSSSSQGPVTEHEFSDFSTDSSTSTYIVSIREIRAHGEVSKELSVFWFLNAFHALCHVCVHHTQMLLPRVGRTLIPIAPSTIRCMRQYLVCPFPFVLHRDYTGPWVKTLKVIIMFYYCRSSQ